MKYVKIYIYTYMVPPLRSTSEHFDILSLHVNIIYIHVYLFSEFTDICAILLFFSMFKCFFFSLASILYFQKVV